MCHLISLLLKCQFLCTGTLRNCAVRSSVDGSKYSSILFLLALVGPLGLANFFQVWLLLPQVRILQLFVLSLVPFSCQGLLLKLFYYCPNTFCYEDFLSMTVNCSTNATPKFKEYQYLR